MIIVGRRRKGGPAYLGERVQCDWGKAEMGEGSGGRKMQRRGNSIIRVEEQRRTVDTGREQSKIKRRQAPIPFSLVERKEPQRKVAQEISRGKLI